MCIEMHINWKPNRREFHHHQPAARFQLDRFKSGYLIDEEGTGAQHNLH